MGNNQLGRRRRRWEGPKELDENAWAGSNWIRTGTIGLQQLTYEISGGSDFCCPWRVTTIHARDQNSVNFKKNQILYRISFHWLNNLKFVDSINFFLVKIFNLPAHPHFAAPCIQPPGAVAPMALTPRLLSPCTKTRRIS